MNEQIDTSQNDCAAPPSVILSDNNENYGMQMCEATQNAMSTTFKTTVDEAGDTARDQAKDHAHVELQSSTELPVSPEILFGCSTGNYVHKIEQISVPMKLRHM